MRTDAHRRLSLKWMQLRGRCDALTRKRDQLRISIIDAMGKPASHATVPPLAARVRELEAELSSFASAEHAARLAVKEKEREEA